MDWWPRYRAAWCLNNLDMPDSARVLASEALSLAPGSECCLAELLKAVSDEPDRVLEYSYLVSGGGSCRYRLARAELQKGDFQGESLAWLLDSFENGDSASAADAGCWLSILFPDKGLQYIERSVELMPGEVFYRCLLVERLIDFGDVQGASAEFDALSPECADDVHYWGTAASLHEALGETSAALEASRRAYQLRMVPATAADLGWRLYFAGRDLIRENRMSEAVPFLIECSSVWSPESSWALRADSLLDLTNLFTSVSDGFGEPL